MQAEERQSTNALLTVDEIREGLTNGDVIIWPFEEGKVTSAGYDLTPTEWVFSLNSRLLMPIILEGLEKFCWVEPQDTVLVLTREAIRFPPYVAGTLLSKSSLATAGFGHFSIALDEHGQGPLLIPLQNPTKQRVKLPFTTVDAEGELHEHTLVALRFDSIRSFLGVRSDLREARLPIPPMSGKSDPLAACWHGMAEINFLAGQGESFDPELFKQKYEEARKRIQFLTERGQKISQEIWARQKLWEVVRQVGYGGVIVGLLSYMGYQAVVFGDGTFLAFGGLLLGVLFLGRK